MKKGKTDTFLGKEELYGQLSDTKLKIALLAQQEKETETMLSEDDPAKSDDEERFFAATQGHTMRRINAQLRKESLQRFARHNLPRIGQAAAAALLVFYLGLTTAVATVPSVRVGLMRMLYNVKDQYTEINFQPDQDASFDVPPEWDGYYFMSYIPDGYTLVTCTPHSSFDQEVIYEDAANGQLRFTELSLDAETNVDTEGYSVSPVQINSSSGIIAEKANETTIIWSTTDRYFVLHVQGSADTALQIAEKVVRIK